MHVITQDTDFQIDGCWVSSQARFSPTFLVRHTPLPVQLYIGNLNSLIPSEDFWMHRCSGSMDFFVCVCVNFIYLSTHLCAYRCLCVKCKMTELSSAVL